MSINRKTLAYRKRVRRLAQDICWETCTLFAGDQPRTLLQIVREREPNAPQYLVRDALIIAAQRLPSQVADAQAHAEMYAGLLDQVNAMLLQQRRGPVLKVVGGAA